MSEQTIRPALRLFVGKDVHKFSCAHMTIFSGGKKERLHGHNFQVSIALEPFGDDAPLIDFGVLKAALQAQCDAWAERLLLPGASPYLEVMRQGEGELEFRLCGKRYVVPSEEVLILPIANVVVEALARVFAEALEERLRGAVTMDGIAAAEITIVESQGQGATYRWTPRG